MKYLAVTAVVITGIITCAYLVMHGKEWWGLAIFLFTVGTKLVEKG